MEEEERRRKEEELRKKKLKEEEKKAEEEKKRQLKETEDRIKKEALLKKIRPEWKRNTATQRKEVEQLTPMQKKSEKKPAIPKIRTYKNDIAETIQKKDVSLTTITIAEKNEAKEKKSGVVESTTKNEKSTLKILLFGFGILIFLVFSGLFLFSLNKKEKLPAPSDSSGFLTNTTNKDSQKRTAATTVVSIIPADTEKGIGLYGENDNVLKEISKEVKKIAIPDSIENIYLKGLSPVEGTGLEKRTQSVAGTRELLSVWVNTMPPILARSLSEEFMLGVYTYTSSKNTPFLIFKTNSYEQTLAGMFAWEKNILNDFYRLFGLEIKETRGVFIDKVIDGEDTRILKNTDGEIILVYSFVDENTLIITLNKEAFVAIVSRLRQ